MLHPNSDSSKYEISQGLLSSTLVIYTPNSDQQYIAERAKRYIGFCCVLPARTTVNEDLLSQWYSTFCRRQDLR